MSRKGWFKIPGLQDGDRTADQQLMGLAPALAECAGKTVVDFGCAEGIISREFAKAGAKSVFGIDSVADHITVARKLCKDYSQVGFLNQELKGLIEQERALKTKWRYDIVLILGIIQKLHDPNLPTQFAAEATGELLLFRAPAKSWDGKVRSKFTKAVCDTRAVFNAAGLAYEKTIKGTMGESVEYWRKKVV